MGRRAAAVRRASARLRLEAVVGVEAFQNMSAVLTGRAVHYDGLSSAMRTKAEPCCCLQPHFVGRRSDRLARLGDCDGAQGKLCCQTQLLIQITQHLASKIFDPNFVRHVCFLFSLLSEMRLARHLTTYRNHLTHPTYQAINAITRLPGRCLIGA